jgi:hypothetical protein
MLDRNQRLDTHNDVIIKWKEHAYIEISVWTYTNDMIAKPKSHAYIEISDGDTYNDVVVK